MIDLVVLLLGYIGLALAVSWVITKAIDHMEPWDEYRYGENDAYRSDPGEHR